MKLGGLFDWGTWRNILTFGLLICAEGTGNALQCSRDLMKLGVGNLIKANSVSDGFALAAVDINFRNGNKKRNNNGDIENAQKSTRIEIIDGIENNSNIRIPAIIPKTCEDIPVCYEPCGICLRNTCSWEEFIHCSHYTNNKYV